MTTCWLLVLAVVATAAEKCDIQTMDASDGSLWTPLQPEELQIVTPSLNNPICNFTEIVQMFREELGKYHVCSSDSTPHYKKTCFITKRDGHGYLYTIVLDLPIKCVHSYRRRHPLSVAVYCDHMQTRREDDTFKKETDGPTSTVRPTSSDLNSDNGSGTTVTSLPSRGLLHFENHATRTVIIVSVILIVILLLIILVLYRKLKSVKKHSPQQTYSLVPA